MAREMILDSSFYVAHIVKRNKNSGLEWSRNIGPYDTAGKAQGQLTRELNEHSKYNANIQEVLVAEIRKGNVTWETVDSKAETARIKAEKIAAKKAAEEERVRAAQDLFWKEVNS